jgi:hypothetical protein
LNAAVFAIVAMRRPVPRNPQMMETTFTGVAIAILIVVFGHIITSAQNMTNPTTQPNTKDSRLFIVSSP